VAPGGILAVPVIDPVPPSKVNWTPPALVMFTSLGVKSLGSLAAAVNVDRQRMLVPASGGIDEQVSAPKRGRHAYRRFSRMR